MIEIYLSIYLEFDGYTKNFEKKKRNKNVLIHQINCFYETVGFRSANKSQLIKNLFFFLYYFIKFDITNLFLVIFYKLNPKVWII